MSTTPTAKRRCSKPKTIADPARRVYKYSLQLGLGSQQVEMPHGANIVHVHAQNERPVLWAEVNTSAPVVRRTFTVVSTGQDVPVGWAYIGTVHIGWKVWHVYEDVIYRG